MRILLIVPPKSDKTVSDFNLEPLDLEYIAAGLSLLHEVKIADLQFENNFEDILKKFNPQIVGMNVYTYQVNTAKRICKMVKQYNSKILTVVGGRHAMTSASDFNEEFIDLIMINRGIKTFWKIAEQFMKDHNFNNTEGLAFRKDGNLFITKQEPLINLDDYPFPKRDLTLKYRKYYHSSYFQPLASIKTSHGCLFKCTFCIRWKLTKGKYQARSPESVVNELEKINEESILFLDNDSMINEAGMERLAHFIKKRGIKKNYIFFTRSDSVIQNKDLFRLWRELGLKMVYIGLESYLDKDLKTIKKGVTVTQNEKAVNILHKIGVKIAGHFIIFQYYDHNNFKELGNYVKRLKIDFPHYSVCTPLPGTDYYEQVKKEIINHDFDLFDYLHTQLPTKLPLREFYKEYIHLYLRSINIYSQINVIFYLLNRFKIVNILFRVVRGYKILKQIKIAHRNII